MIDRDRLEPVSFAALRVIAGAFMFCHGAQKLFGMFGDRAEVGSQLWIGGILELVLGAAVAVGFYTRLAAFILSGEMAVAYFQFHWKLDFGHGRFLPLVNKGELAVVYCFVFLFIWVHGPGPHSVDRRRGLA